MDKSDFIIEERIEARAERLDGAPPDYWQVYSDDNGPFEFPLYSAWVTKALGGPQGFERRVWPLIWSFYRAVLIFGVLAVRLDSWLVMGLGLLVAGRRLLPLLAEFRSEVAFQAQLKMGLGESVA